MRDAEVSGGRIEHRGSTYYVDVTEEALKAPGRIIEATTCQPITDSTRDQLKRDLSAETCPPHRCHWRPPAPDCRRQGP